jgi:large subunit ribosomal protein L23
MGQLKIKKNKDGISAAAQRFDYDVFLKPIVTEKTAQLDSSDKKRIAFKVPQSATKESIRIAIEKVFGVKVDSINTANFQGKVKRTAKGAGRRVSFKKAYVTLKKGETLDVVEGI